MAVRSLFPILRTTDLPGLVDFYARALGAEVAYRFSADDGTDAYVSLELGPAALGIGADPDATRSSGDRVALWFYVSDVDAAFEAVLRSGGVSVREPTDMPWGERVAQIRDTDGNLVNLAAEGAE